MSKRRILASVVWGLVLTAGASHAASDGVPEFHAFLVPAFNDVAVDSLVEITFEVDETALQFNGYEIEITFDPAVVSFDSVDEGSLMTTACGTRFTNIETTASTVTYSHVLLCSGVSIDGPGVLSTFRFRAEALGTSAIEPTSDPDRTFFDDGLFIFPGHLTFPRQVVLTGAVIDVTDEPLAAGDAGPGTVASRVAFLPHPIMASARIRVTLPAGAGGGLLSLFDVAGREVRRWQLDASDRWLSWDVRDAEGRAVPSGVYVYRVETGRRPVVSGTVRVVR